MKQLVDCIGMSARKRVLESGKKPRILQHFVSAGGGPSFGSSRSRSCIALWNVFKVGETSCVQDCNGRPDDQSEEGVEVRWDSAAGTPKQTEHAACS